MEQRLSISRVAAAYRISPRTLRFYEASGLITSHRREDSRYREYDRAQCQRLEVILLLRRLSFGVGEIGRLLNGGDEHLRVLLKEKIHAANRQIAEAAEVSRLLRDVLAALDSATLGDLRADEILNRYLYLTQKTERLIPMQENEKYLLLVGFELIPLLGGEDAPDNIYGMIVALRESLQNEGLDMPKVRLRDDKNILPSEAVLHCEGVEFWRKTYDAGKTTREAFGKEVTAQLEKHMRGV